MPSTPMAPPTEANEMAGTTQRGGIGAITGINVTPLVDIILVLLIVFMVTAKMIVRQHAVPLDLPKAVSGQDVQEIFSVSLTAGGATYLNGTPIANDDALSAPARAAQTKNKDLRVV